MNINQLEEKAYQNEISPSDALSILESESSYFFEILGAANRIREKYKGNKIGLCSIINAKSGKCGEDCAFCPQSVHHETDISEYALVDEKEIFNSSHKAKEQMAGKFGIVTSGKGVKNRKELETIYGAISRINEHMHCCASLGILSEERALELREAGLKEYHHNIETARSFFSQICSTHSYDENVNTVIIAKKVGLRVCCGGIFGMGESNEQRVELSITLKELDVDTIPINFLNPISGTRLEHKVLLSPREALLIIAMFRFVHPQKDIKVAGGREMTLKDLQPFMFMAGANSTMIGNYLTTKGRNYQDDIAMIHDLGLETA